MALQADIKALFEAGAHFGHKTSRWHPKMAPYIHSKRQDSHIIDLAKTVEASLAPRSRRRTSLAKLPRQLASRMLPTAGSAGCSLM